MKVWRTAQTLERLRPRVKGARLPCAFFVTDPGRVADPLAVARVLPRGAGVIFRGFGKPGAEEQARALSQIAKSRGLVLLIGADAALARKVGAAGVHMPQRDLQSIRRLRAQHPNWIITVAAHSPAALARATASGAHAALYSTVFASDSPSAGAPIGPVKLGLAVRRSGLPVFALGGVHGTTAGRLIGTGVAGFAAVDAFRR
jgi:thiamine-phosphate pyrophosphorylase